MGQGMCAGIRDAANLGWKLADVIDGAADESLLDTYESERSPHVREFIETAVRLGGLIQATDPHEARQRDAEMRATRPVFKTPSPQLGPGLHEGGAFAGYIGEQPALGDGMRLDDRIGYRAALLVDPDWAIGPVGDHLTVVHADSPAAMAWLRRLGARAVLQRPDRYVVGVANDRQSLDRLIGAWRETAARGRMRAPSTV